jgi:hypothetical protein
MKRGITARNQKCGRADLPVRPLLSPARDEKALNRAMRARVGAPIFNRLKRPTTNSGRNIKPTTSRRSLSSHPRSLASPKSDEGGSAVKIIPITMRSTNSNHSSHIPTAFRRVPSFWNLIGPTPPGRSAPTFQPSVFDFHLTGDIFFQTPNRNHPQWSMHAFCILHSSFFIAFRSCPVAPNRARGGPLFRDPRSTFRVPRAFFWFNSRRFRLHCSHEE